MVQIIIGPITYRVRRVKELANEHGAICGDCNSSKARIRICADDDPQVQVVTLWHEILHGILYNAGMHDHDETVVDALAYGLVQVLRDNPFLAPHFGADTRPGQAPRARSTP